MRLAGRRAAAAGAAGSTARSARARASGAASGDAARRRIAEYVTRSAAAKASLRGPAHRRPMRRIVIGMGKVVKLDTSGADRQGGGRADAPRPAPPAALEVGAGARRRRLHRRRLRDRRAARARPAVGQPDGQRVRRLRRDERRVVRRRRGGQRRHARGDDAGHRPAGPDPVSRRPRQLAAEAQLPRVPDQGRRCSRCGWPSCCASSSATWARSRRSTSSLGLAEALPSGLYSGEGIERYVRTDPVRSRPHRRLPAARPRALPRRHRPRHLRADRARQPRAGTTSRSRGRSAPRARCR